MSEEIGLSMPPHPSQSAARRPSAIRAPRVSDDRTCPGWVERAAVQSLRWAVVGGCALFWGGVAVLVVF